MINNGVKERDLLVIISIHFVDWKLSIDNKPSLPQNISNHLLNDLLYTMGNMPLSTLYFPFKSHTNKSYYTHLRLVQS